MIDNPILVIKITLAAIAIFLLTGWCAKRSEAKGWNGGNCKECGTKWENFDMVSQGGRGYHCQCEKRHSFWTSYNVDK